MAAILGLGCTHWPVLAWPDSRLTSTFKRTLASVACPPEFRDPAHWPTALREELGDDEGLAAARAHSTRLATSFRRMRREIDAFEPDVVLIWGDDQYENFREDIVPPFCVLAYDDMTLHPWQRRDGSAAPNRWDEPADFSVAFTGHRAAAKALTGALIDQGIDMSYAYQPLHEPGLSHAFMNTLLFLDWDRQGFPYPVIPLAVNCYGRSLFKAKGGLGGLQETAEQRRLNMDPPSPSPKRCMEVGAATARFFERSDYRVALIASASWSHAFLSPKRGLLFSDMDADRVLFDSMRKGNYDVWRNQSRDDMEAAGQHEVLNWMMLMGAMEHLGRKPEVIDYVETHLFTSQKCFTIFK